MRESQTPKPKRQRNAPRRKARLTLSLDEATVRFLHRRQAEVKAPSLSAAVEDLVAASRRRREEEELNAQITAYYDALTEKERAEDRAWGELGAEELLKNGDLD